MDLEQQVAQLNKKIEKLVRVLTDCTALSQSQRIIKENQVKDLQKELAALQQQL